MTQMGRGADIPFTVTVTDEVAGVYVRNVDNMPIEALMIALQPTLKALIDEMFEAAGSGLTVTFHANIVRRSDINGYAARF